MPNNVTNELTILSGDHEKVFEFMKTEDSKFDFNRIIPMPDYLFKSGISMSVKEVLGPGYNWYDWCQENWQTKWSAYSVERTAPETIRFETAWNGVPRLMVLLLDKFQVKDALYRYADEDFGSNVGKIAIEDGQYRVSHIEDGSLEAFEIAAALMPDWVSHSEGEEGAYFDAEKGTIEWREGSDV